MLILFAFCTNHFRELTKQVQEVHETLLDMTPQREFIFLDYSMIVEKESKYLQVGGKCTDGTIFFPYPRSVITDVGKLLLSKPNPIVDG